MLRIRILVAAFALCWTGIGHANWSFVRGDADGDGNVQINDAIQALAVVFVGEAPNCRDAIDSNDDGSVDIGDPIFLLNFLFQGDVPPSSPYPNCGEDPTTDALGCQTPSPLCESGPGVVFATPSLEVAYQPLQLAVADFDHDGNDDLVLISQSLADPQVALGNGDGSFQPVESIATSETANDVVTGDFDGDGNPDFATSHSDWLIVFLGDGTGHFSGGTPFWLGVVATSYQPVEGIATGDYDGDGELDMAMPLYNSDLVVIMRGLGNGSFTSSELFSTGDQPTAVQFGDVNNDGRDDLLVSTTPAEMVYLSTPTGFVESFAFDPSTSGSFCTSRFGDFNSDGQLDMFARDLEAAYFLPGLADGTFGPAAVTPVGVCCGGTVPRVRLVDFNGDSHLDALASSRDEVEVWIGDGAGPPTRERAYGVGLVIELGLGDFNADGNWDLASIESVPFFPGFHVQITRGLGNGEFDAPSESDSDETVYSIALADLDLDGELEAIAAAQSAMGEPRISVYELAGLPAPMLVSSTPAPVTDRTRLVVRDFDDDGFPDVYAASIPDGSILLGRGDLTFETPTTTLAGAFPLPYFPASNDVNGDGILDLVVAARSAGQAWRVRTALGIGDGTFGTAVTYQVPDVFDEIYLRFEITDVNQDGLTDLVALLLEPKQIRVFHGLGDGSFDLAQTLSAPGILNFSGNGDRMGLGVFDIDSDSWLDIIHSSSDPLPWIENPGKISLFRGSSGGYSTDSETLAEGSWANDYYFEDMDGDGIRDLLSMDLIPASGFAVNPGSGELRFLGEQSYEALNGIRDHAVGDVDGDGDADIVAVSWYRKVILNMNRSVSTP